MTYDGIQKESTRQELVKEIVRYRRYRDEYRAKSNTVDDKMHSLFYSEQANKFQARVDGIREALEIINDWGI